MCMRTRLSRHRRDRINHVAVNCMVKVNEKFCKRKYRPVDILLNDNAMIYFKSKLHLKFVKNKTYYSKAVNFHNGLP